MLCQAEGIRVENSQVALIIRQVSQVRVNSRESLTFKRRRRKFSGQQVDIRPALVGHIRVASLLRSLGQPSKLHESTNGRENESYNAIYTIRERAAPKSIPRFTPKREKYILSPDV